MSPKPLLILTLIAASLCACHRYYTFYTITNLSDSTIDFGYAHDHRDSIGLYWMTVTPGQSLSQSGSLPLEEAFPSDTLGLFVYDDKKLKASYDTTTTSYFSHIRQAEIKKIVISIDSLRKVNLKIWYP